MATSGEVPKDAEGTPHRVAHQRIAEILNDFQRQAKIARVNGAWDLSGSQPLDADLTAIAALTTTSYGRSVLTLADIAAAQAYFHIPVVLFDHFADAGNGTTVETDLYSDTLAAGRLANNGEKIEAWYSGVTVNHATATRQIRVYFGGTVIYDSTAQVTATVANWSVGVRVIREGSGEVRCDVSFNDNLNLAAWPGAQYTRITGLTLSNQQILKITGQAGGVGAATNDLVAKLGSGKFYNAV